MRPRAPVPAELVDGPFRRRDALALGITPRTLGGPQFRRVLHTVYVAAAAPDSVELRYDAARLVMRGPTVASHHSAAVLWGLPVPTSAELHLTVPTAAERRRSGVTPHVGALDDDVRRRDGRLLLSPERTFCDLAAARPPLGLVDLVILGDAAVRRGRTTPAALVSRTTRMTGRGCRLARTAAALVRARVDSPMETRLRLLLVFGGLPEPEINVPIDFADGSGWLATPDLLYREARIAIEYDGEHHRTDRQQWRDDRWRGRLLRDDGWDLIECTADDVFHRPAATLSWLHERLRAAGHPGVPAAPSDGWRRHWTHTSSGSRRARRQ